MAIQQDAQDYYYNITNGYSCWGGGAVTPDGFYEPSNYYMINNAKLIYQDLIDKGWSYNAIMAVLGNMCYESCLNPAQSEIGKPLNGSYGYGLAQWTPRNITIEPYMADHNYPLTSGYYQCFYLDTGAQWTPKPSYNISWNDFKHSHLSVEYLTNAFLKCYEQGQDNSYRYYCASFYETYFGGAQTSCHIYVNTTGNGYSYVAPQNVQDGDSFTLYNMPYGSDRLVDVIGWTQNGQSIAMGQPDYEMHYTYDQTNWGDYIRIEIEYSGDTPPIPPTPVQRIRRKTMPIWMYPNIRFW